MEQYGLDGLVASAEAVLPGLGPLAAGFARLAGEAGRAVTLEAMELQVIEGGRELLRGLVQLALDGQAEREVRLPQVTGADGVTRTRAERGHGRPVVTRLGEVRVERIAYRSGVRGAGSLFPRDAVLNLPPCGYSWPLQQLAEMFARSVSYEQAHEFVLAATGVSVGKRQLEQIIIAAADDAERFYQDRLQEQEQAGEPDRDLDLDLDRDREPGLEPGLPPLALSGDGKGVAMLPEARRRRTRAPEQKVRTFEKRAGTGEKQGCKRMAETGAVFDVIVPEGPPRTPEQVMRPDPGAGQKEPPRAENRWYTCDITAGRDVTAGKIFDQADRRDPGHARTWIALLDGDNYQLGLFQAAAAARGITLEIVIDFIHVLEYLWKAAWCFHPPRDPAIEDWVTAQALDILHGRVHDVIERIGRLAEDHPPRPGGEHAKNIRKTLSYLRNKQPWMDYPRALAAGWPIATGVIEGACRHLVADRMGITGARWSLDGAQAMLWLRAINASGDTSAYWAWHITQEHQRNHLSRYQDNLELAA
ncbi:MAG: ISKra4 family transposase [Actinobacteria bacterium]|nr:ISKra4 family transposase [Actinomycetota bacterium]